MSRQEVDAALDRESARYAQSLDELTRGEMPLSGRVRSLPFVIAPFHCARVIFGSTAGYPLADVHLEAVDLGREHLMTRWDWEIGWGGALGWCAGDEPTEATLATSGDGGELVYRVLAGPVGERWEAFLSGRMGYGPEYAQVAASRARVAADAAERARGLGGPIVQDVPADRALVVPAAAGPRFALRAVATVERPDPAYEPRTVGPDESVDGRHPPVAFLEGDTFRVVLALDAADLPQTIPTRCAAVDLWRLSEARERVTRIDLGAPDAGELRVGEADLSQTVCPEDGLVVFGVAERDLEAWRVRVLPAPGGRADGRLRGPTPVPDQVPVAAVHRRARNGCAAGVVDDCMSTAEHLATGQYASRDLSEALVLAERACGQAPVHCGKLGDYEAMAGRPANAVVRWRTGCSNGDGWACMQLGEALRLGAGAPFAPQAALDAYERAWRSGIDYYVAHPRIEAMKELRLGR